jgi:hypothetical protein
MKDSNSIQKISRVLFSACLIFSITLSCSDEPTDITTGGNNGNGNGGGGASGGTLTPLHPCENGMAGPYPCNDYDLLGTISAQTLGGEAGTEGSDIWGWTDPVDNSEYALIALTNSTAFINVTDPTNPVFLGRLNSSAGTNFWRDVKVYNKHAFIVADGV